MTAPRIIRRTFEASRHPKGTTDRALLQGTIETSGRHRHMRWMTRDQDNRYQLFRTRREAEQYTRLQTS